MCTSVYFGWGMIGHMQVKILERAGGEKRHKWGESKMRWFVHRIIRVEKSYLCFQKKTIATTNEMMRHTSMQICHVQVYVQAGIPSRVLPCVLAGTLRPGSCSTGCSIYEQEKGQILLMPPLGGVVQRPTSHLPRGVSKLYHLLHSLQVPCSLS